MALSDSVMEAAEALHAGVTHYGAADYPLRYNADNIAWVQNIVQLLREAAGDIQDGRPCRDLPILPSCVVTTYVGPCDPEPCDLQQSPLGIEPVLSRFLRASNAVMQDKRLREQGGQVDDLCNLAVRRKTERTGGDDLMFCSWPILFFSEESSCRARIQPFLADVLGVADGDIETAMNGIRYSPHNGNGPEHQIENSKGAPFVVRAVSYAKRGAILFDMRHIEHLSHLPMVSIYVRSKMYNEWNDDKDTRKYDDEVLLDLFMVANYEFLSWVESRSLHAVTTVDS